MSHFRKFPRTPHLLDSRLQPGDEGMKVADFSAIVGRQVVVEEKVDGANAAVSFWPDGGLLLQSRGHALVGGPRERHFSPFKAWAEGLRPRLWERIGARYVVYGEWLHAKHTVYYDSLPAWFLEFDILDRETDRFLTTADRRSLLEGLPICSVPVLHQGLIDSAPALVGLLGRSAYKSADWREALVRSASAPPHRIDLIAKQTDPSDLMEGLYVKVEEGGSVLARYKYVRQDFLSQVADSESHWLDRPILPNRLRPRSEGSD